MKTLTIGPLFTAYHPSVSENPRIIPLDFQLEWATAEEAAAISLFRHAPQHEPNRVRLERLVFASAQLPFELECPEHQVVQTTLGTYLPLEALFSGLYSRYEISRSIFVVLAELAELVPLSGSVRRPIATPGLLTPQVEQKGFVLNSLIRDRDRVFCEIGWRPPSQEYVFHTCVCEFLDGQSKVGDAGRWKHSNVIGVSQPLTHELRSLAPGTPEELFTSLGRSLLANSTHLATAAQG